MLILYDHDLDLKELLRGISQCASCQSSRNVIIVQPPNLSALNNNNAKYTPCVRLYSKHFAYPSPFNFYDKPRRKHCLFFFFLVSFSYFLKSKNDKSGGIVIFKFEKIGK